MKISVRVLLMLAAAGVLFGVCGRMRASVDAQGVEVGKKPTPTPRPIPRPTRKPIFVSIPTPRPRPTPTPVTPRRWLSSLDDYEVKRGITVNDKLDGDKAVLSPETKLVLDEIAAQAKAENALIEVSCCPLAGGYENDSKLSLLRHSLLSSILKDLVERYLAENHMIPLRRIISPSGCGEAQPVVPNENKEGHEHNGCVEVRILAHKG